MLFAVSGARSDVEWKDVSLVPAAVNGGKQADTGTLFLGSLWCQHPWGLTSNLPGCESGPQSSSTIILSILLALLLFMSGPF